MDTIFKADIRLEVINELGNQLDDALEKAKSETLKREGAHGALVAAVRNIRMLLAAADGSPELTDAHKAVAKMWVNRAVTELAKQAEQAGNLVMAARGAELQAKASVQAAKALFDLEAAKRQRVMEPPAALVEGEKPHKVPRTLKERRLAEETQSPVIDISEAKRAKDDKTKKPPRKK